MKNLAWLICLSLGVAGSTLGCGDDDDDEGEENSITVTEATATECPNGGLTVSVGVDEDGDGSLTGDEIESTYSACNGAKGADGTNGTNGVDGTNGTNGTNGQNGAQGEQGDQGEQGTEGAAASTETFTIGGTVSGLGDDQSVTLQINGEDDLSVSDNDDFTFETEVEFGTKFEVTVLTEPVAGRKCDVINGSDIAVRDISNIEIDCAPSWNYPEEFSDFFNPKGYLEDTDTHRVAMDDNGNALIVWGQVDGDYDRIFLSEYRNGSWTHPKLSDPISVDNDNDAYDPVVAMSNDGTAVIAWTQYDDSYDRIYYMEYRDDEWSTPAPISPTGQNARDPDVAMDDSGNAVIAWTQSDGSYSQIYVADYNLTDQDTWTAPDSLADDNVSVDGYNTNGNVSVAVDDGHAVIAYTQHDGSNYRVYTVDFDVTDADAWTKPDDLSADALSLAGQHAYNPDVAMDNGVVLLAWEQSDGSDAQIYTADYNLTEDDDWTKPASLADDHISANGYDAYSPKLAMGGGQAVIVFYQTNEDGYDMIYAYEYRDSDWSSEPKLLSPNMVDMWDPEVAMDDSGDTVVIWAGYESYDDFYVTYMAEYRDETWHTPNDLADFISIWGSGEDDALGRVAMDNNGNAIMVWSENGPEVYYDSGYFNLYMAEYR